MEKSVLRQRVFLKILVSIVLILVVSSIVVYNIYPSNNAKMSFDKEKLKKIYELKVPLINISIRISDEYVGKIQEYVLKNLTYVQQLGFNDTVFEEFVKNSLSYLERANKTSDNWERLKLLRKAYFELVKAKAYFLYKKGKISIQKLYNETHNVEKTFRKYKNEILEKDIYIGKNIDSAVIRGYKIERVLIVGESYIHNAYNTLGLEELPLEKKIVEVAHSIAVVKTMINDSYEVYREAFQGMNLSNMRSYKEIIKDAYWKIHDLVKRTAEEKLKNINEKTYVFDLKYTIYGYIRFSENHYKQKYYSTALIEIIKAYAHLQCIDAAREVPSLDALDSQTNITLDELYKVKKELVDLIKEKLEKYRNYGIMLLILKDGYYEIGAAQIALSRAIYNDTSPRQIAYHISMAYMFFTVFKQYYENVDITYDMIIETLYNHK